MRTLFNANSKIYKKVNNKFAFDTNILLMRANYTYLQKYNEKILQISVDFTFNVIEIHSETEYSFMNIDFFNKNRFFYENSKLVQ